VDQFHRQHAVVELVIRDAKEAGLEHIPSGSFSANGAWLCCAVLAHNLIRWTVILGDAQRPHRLTVARTVRIQRICVAARLVNRAGTPTLRWPRNWPWGQTFCDILDALRAIEPATG